MTRKVAQVKSFSGVFGVISAHDDSFISEYVAYQLDKAKKRIEKNKVIDQEIAKLSNH